MNDSALTTQYEPATAVWTVIGAAIVSMVTYGAVERWWGGSGTLLAVPVLYTLMVVAAALLVYLLWLRGQFLEQPATLWLAAGFAIAGSAALLQAITIITGSNGSALATTPNGAAGLHLVWHAALPLCTLGAMLSPSRTRVRTGVIIGFGLLLVASTTEPTWLPLPDLVDASGRFTLLYRLASAALLPVILGVTIAWFIRIVRHASRTESWVGVALVLLALELAVSSATASFFDASWWSAVTLRTAQFVLPAVALLVDQGRLLRQLRTHEQALAHRFEEELQNANRARAEPTTDDAIEHRITLMMATESFHTEFQPIYRLDDGRLLAVEALTRFDHHPYRPPNVWFDEAASVGLSEQLEIETIRAALDAASELPPDVALSLNVSTTLLEHGRWLYTLLEAHKHRNLIVEIADHATAGDHTRRELVLAELKTLGIRIAVDDTRFTSLHDIARLAPDIIKLDTTPTRSTVRDPVRHALAASLIHYAQQNGTLLIAQGIENRQDLRTWNERGAHAGQGYLLGKPAALPAPTFAQPPLIRLKKTSPVWTSTRVLHDQSKPVAATPTP